VGKTIVKEYTAFAADGYKSWDNNEPEVHLVVCQDGKWVYLDLSLEEAEKAIVILQEAMAEAKSLPDHDLTPWDETLF
jgi:hypothetical protein